jgi:xanthine dehydrogenase accessory factor
MSELRQILDLWQRARDANEEVCLATVVGIEGSAYRRPGARMLLTASGQRAGTVSGGCLEGEIAKKAWWLTANGPSIQRYSSFFDDDGDMPYGLGCGGTVLILLERGEAARQGLEAIRRSVEQRMASVIVIATGSTRPGTVLILNETGAAVYRSTAGEPAQNIRAEAMASEALLASASRIADKDYVEFVAPPPALFVFGAGDDAQPLVQFAAAQGWYVTVADGRAQLLRAERFPEASRVLSLGNALGGPAPDDAAVIMTHSYEQDRQILRALLPLNMKYLGVLGPRRRSERLSSEVAEEIGLTPEECLARLHSPVGLDLGGHSPAAIALSIAAELQAVLAGRDAKKLSIARLIHL